MLCELTTLQSAARKLAFIRRAGFLNDFFKVFNILKVSGLLDKLSTIFVVE